MEKEDKIIEILAWILIVMIIVFCIWFNYEIHANDYVAPEKIETSDLYL